MRTGVCLWVFVRIWCAFICVLRRACVFSVWVCNICPLPWHVVRGPLFLYIAYKICVRVCACAFLHTYLVWVCVIFFTLTCPLQPQVLFFYMVFWLLFFVLFSLWHVLYYPYSFFLIMMCVRICSCVSCECVYYCFCLDMMFSKRHS